MRKKHRIFTNLPRGNFEAQDNDDYEEIDDDMLDEGSDIEDPDFYISLFLYLFYLLFLQL